MVAAYSAAASLQQAQVPPVPELQQQQQQQQKLEENGRIPLALSEKNNGIPRKPRNREVTSRYKSSSTSSSRRCPSPSPNVGRAPSTSDPPSIKRALSAERRRPSPSPGPESRVANGLVEAAKRTSGRAPEGLLWPSTRSLSVSFQRESISCKASGRDKTNGHNTDHTLKPAANIVQKTGDMASNMQRKGTPERKGTPRRPIRESENAKPVDNSHSKPDQHRWPGKNPAKAMGNPMTRSVDLTDRTGRAAALLVQCQSALGTTRTSTSLSVNRASKRSINEGPVDVGASNATRRATFDGRLRIPTKGFDPNQSPTEASDSGISNGTIDETNRPAQSPQEAELSSSDAGIAPCDLASDTESVSSGGNSVGQEISGTLRRTNSGGHIGTTRGTTVPARFWQETNNRLRRSSSGLRSSLQESDLPSGFLKSAARLKVIPSAGSSVMNGQERALVSPRLPNRTPASPLPYAGVQHPSSPHKTISSASSSPSSRSLPSPTRTRLPPSLPPPNSMHSRPQSASSVLNFGVDIRKGKKGLNQLEEAHHLRILHTRLLQWRFVNARAEAAMNAQRITAEKLLYNVWVTTSELHDSVTMKRNKLQQIRLENKLSCILRGQMSFLEEWALLERDHSSSLSGAVEALEATTLRLPVTGGARADVQAVKEAVSSAVDVMQAMGSSVCSLLPKVEGMNHLVSELAEVAAQEKLLLDECVDLLTTTTAMEVEESSLRAHFVQLKQGRHWKNQSAVTLLSNGENEKCKEIS